MNLLLPEFKDSPNNISYSIKGANIISSAKKTGLNTALLYETVVDLSSEGLVTAGCINLAAGILLNDLGLPYYFFENISKESLKSILSSIASSIKIRNNKVFLYDRVAQIQFDTKIGKTEQMVRIATEETRDSMEKSLAKGLNGHRREYYYSPENKYYTYLIKPGTVFDYREVDFKDSRFLFNLSDDFDALPVRTRKRYETFLTNCEKSVSPLIETYNLPESGETRFMFKSDFVSPMFPILRKLFADHNIVLKRGYWEPYYGSSDVSRSICSLYVIGELTRKQESWIINDLCSFLSFGINNVIELYINEKLNYIEMLFAGNAVDFTHMFIYKDNPSDKSIINSLSNIDNKEAFASRLQDSNKSSYISRIIAETVKHNPDLIKFLYSIFNKKFNPENKIKFHDSELNNKFKEFEKIISIRFIDSQLEYDIFKFMFRIITCTLKTNFYKSVKRSFAFRFTSEILDPLVFNQYIYGIFFVNGHYACGTHMRAADIARGGLRMIRVSSTNYTSELDNAVLLNYALGPKAQRLKHKDICESGSKGVIVPNPAYASDLQNTLYDYTEGIMDLIIPSDKVIDYLGKPEMVFFGPDEGTASLMDKVSYQAKERGYKHWRTITTGKSFGIPHDTYGILDNGDVFGLFDNGKYGTDLQINGKSVICTNDTSKIFDLIGGRIKNSGMTTTSVMSSFRTLISHYSDKEEDLNMVMTGGPDGDLGANEIQCYKGKICLLIDGASILFDPEGLDKTELIKLAFMRNSHPRVNSLNYPVTKLSTKGFIVPRLKKNIILPDGTKIDDGAIFHKSFLTNPENMKYLKQANIQVFIPCGGFKDTINHNNVEDFLTNFSKLKYIVEGANVFFDDSARRYIASKTNIKQIKDSTANKGGVFSSSISEVLTAFLFGKDYEKYMLEDTKMRWKLIKDIMLLIEKFSSIETQMLINLHEKDSSTSLFHLSAQTSEEILALQKYLDTRINKILKNEKIIWKALESYIPSVLTDILGKDKILQTLNSDELQPYRNAIITKKLASTAYYKYYFEWNNFLNTLDNSFTNEINKIF